MKNLMKNKVLLLLAFLFIGAIASCSNQEKSGEVEAPKMSIHEATFLSNKAAVEQHIAYGSDLNVKDEYGSTPLTIASTFGRTEIAVILIEGGADVNALAADGSTALHTASFFCETEIVEALLKAGVDTKIRSSYGSTARESLMPPFSAVKPIYDQMQKDLGALGLKLDYDKIQALRPQIADMIEVYERKQ